MSANSRLTIAVHVLTWITLVDRDGRDLVTSDQIARSVNTNPVIIRRSLADLRRAGLVQVRHGAGAGWRLAREPEAITLLQVYRAVEQEPLFGMHRTQPSRHCPVGRGIRPALSQLYGDIEQTLESELGQTSIADVLRDTLAAQAK